MVFFFLIIIGCDKNLKKYEIVKKNIEFNDIIKTGKFLKNKYYNIYYKDSVTKFPKFGFAVSKKCGNAVVRNKLKRQLRMIVDNNKNLFNAFNDYIIMVRKDIGSISYQEMEYNLINLVLKKGTEK